LQVSISVEAIVKDYIKAKLSEFDIRPDESKDDEDADKNTECANKTISVSYPD
jgi:hypothetical protein